MAMLLSHLRFMLTQKDAFHMGEKGGRLLTLGVQDVHGTHERLAALLAEAGVVPRTIPEDKRRYTASLIVPRERGYAHVKDLFHMMGYDEVETLDYSDAEGADHVHDLNHPVPEDLVARYDAVLDLGVLEHVCDTVQALHNCMRLLKTGGTVMHFVPLFGWHNMCYYNFQPMFLHEVYAANGFGNLRTFINYYPQYNEWEDRPLIYREYQYGDEMLFVVPGRFSNICFFATKTRETGAFTRPIQGFYQRYHARSRDSGPGARGRTSGEPDGRFVARIKAMLPTPILDPLLYLNRRRIRFLDAVLPYWLRERIWLRQRTRFIRLLDRTRKRKVICT